MDSYLDDLDRKCFNISSWMANVFAETYGVLGYRVVMPLDPKKFDNATNRIKEIGIRSLIILGGVLSFCFAGTHLLFLAVLLSSGSKLFRALAVYFQKEAFTHIQGKAPEITLKEGAAKVMTWNIRGYGGGLHYSEGGVVHWKSRLERIVESIQEESPEILFLQDIHDGSLIEALIAKLEHSYSHFYTHLGSNVWGFESGCMVITKCAVESFTHTDFIHTDSKGKRGFETIGIKLNPEDPSPCARIIGTQLSSGKDFQQIRMEQVSQVVEHLAKQKLAMPTLFVGTLCNRNSEEGMYLSQYLYHSYLDDQPTHSAELASQWAPIYEGQEESRDYISFFRRNLLDGRILPVLEKGVRLLDSHLVKGFEEDYNTKTALSDSHAVVTIFCGLK